MKYIHYNYGEIFGYRKIHIMVKKKYNVSAEYVRKIMKENNLHSKITKKYKKYSKSPISKIQNHLDRKFKTKENEIVTDLLQIRVKGVWVYVSAAINLKNRRVVSIKTSKYPNAELVVETLIDTLTKIRGFKTLHSDQGGTISIK